jgi:predicted RNase H-like HicB family nuclease
MRIATRDRAQHPETGRHNAEGNVSSYAVVIERASDGGYGVWSPDLPGVVALGDTEAEALQEMRQAIQFHLDGLREDGLPIPQPSTVAATVITLDAA